MEDPDSKQKIGGWLKFGPKELGLWGLGMSDLQEGAQPIALCEAAMIPLGMMAWPAMFRGRCIIWYVDNTSALASLVKGASKNPHLEKIVGITWILAYHRKAEIYFEWVDSKSNWSDGISRDFGNDPVARRLGFTTSPLHLDMSWWQLSSVELWQCAEDLCHGLPLRPLAQISTLSEQALGSN